MIFAQRKRLYHRSFLTIWQDSVSKDIQGFWKIEFPKSGDFPKVENILFLCVEQAAFDSFLFNHKSNFNDYLFDFGPAEFRVFNFNLMRFLN